MADIDTGTVKNFLNFRAVLIAVISIFLAGVVSVVSVTTYLDKRADERFYEKASGRLLEQRIQSTEEGYNKQSAKMETLQQQQNQLLIGIGEIKGKLDIMRNGH